MNFILKVPKEENLISQIKQNYNKLVTQNYGQSETEISSHWQKYLPTVKIELISWGVPSRFLIDQQGIAGLSNINLYTFVTNILSILKNFYLTIKFKCDLVILSKIIMISLKTNRLLNFDMIKHAILVSKINRKVDISSYSNFVIIGDGFGFLGTLLKILYPNKSITFVNLPKNLFLDFIFYSKVFPFSEDSPNLISAHDRINFDKKNTLFFNIASFSEMTVNQIVSYIGAIKEVSGTLVSLNRNTKKHPDGTLVDLDSLFRDKVKNLIFEENPCQFYMHYPTNKLMPLFLPFDGPVHLKIVKF